MFLGALVGPALSDSRVALVVGNGAYAHAKHLPNPAHDAEDVASVLKRTGFDVILGIDLDQAGMQDAAIRFARAADTADVPLFYYSGHAIQYAGINYLAPIDIQLHDEADLRRMTRVDDILKDLQRAKNLRVLVLDSCRDNPLAEELKRSIGSTRALSIGRGLAKMESPEGTIISYSTQAGRLSVDGDGKSRNSPYTNAFLAHIEDKEDIATVFQRISANVYQITKGQQVPELSLSFFGQFYLNGPVQITVAPTTSLPANNPCAAAESHWHSAEAIGTVSAFEDHVAKFPNCWFIDLAKARIEKLKSQVAVVEPPSAPVSPQIAALSGSWVYGRARGTKLYPRVKLCQITLTLQPGPFGNRMISCHPSESYWSIGPKNELIFKNQVGAFTSELHRISDRLWQGPFLNPDRWVGADGIISEITR